MFFKRKKKLSYAILESTDSASLERKVREHLAQGWVCLGGVSHNQIKLHGNHYDAVFKSVWSQAMVKESK